MIDIHCHILPGLDDGSANMEESLAMAKEAAQEGIHTIIATPHHANGKYNNEAEGIIADVVRLNGALAEEGIPLKVLAGQEIRVYSDLIEDFLGKRLLTLGGSSYILIEFSASRIPDRVDELIHELKLLDLIPVIAHPERNMELVSHPERLEKLIIAGACSQVTSHSINGLFGPKIKEAALQMCRSNLVHFISSDAHNIDLRGFGLKNAYEMISEKLGSEFTDYYTNNAQNLIESLPIEIWETKIKRKKWYQLW